MSNEELVKQIQNGAAPDAMVQLYQQNLSFIKKLAKRYQGYAEMEDLLQEGYFGLYEAAQHYEGDSEVLFITYAAYWIKQTLRRYVRSCCQIVRIPEGMADRVMRYRQFIAGYSRSYGKMPSQKTVQQCLGLSAAALKQVEGAASLGQIQSLDEPLRADEELSLADTVGSDEDVAGDVLEGIARTELRRELWTLVDGLEGKLPDVLHRRYEDGLTMQAIGDSLGISSNSARSIEHKAIRTLRRPQYTCRLRPFLTDQEEAAAYHGAVWGVLPAPGPAQRSVWRCTG